MEVNYEKMLQQSNQMKNYIKTDVASLSDQMLNWKPNDKKWSVLEVIRHLNLVYDVYLDNFTKAIDEANPSTGNQKKQSTVIGKIAVYTNRPKNKKIKFKLKTFDFFRPASDPKLKNETLDIFLMNKDRFNELLKSARVKDLTGIKVPTALGQKVKFYVPQCIEFILAHEERHMVQIENTLSEIAR